MNSKRIAIGAAAAVGIFTVGVVVGRLEFGESGKPATTEDEKSAEPAPPPSVSSSSSVEESTPPTAAEPEVEPTDGGFVETFDGNGGFERFRHGVFHRNVDVQGWGSLEGSWTADHDLGCGLPDTQRTLQKSDREGALFMCRDHMMTSMGDVDGYSIVWFSPDQVFDGATTVSWDVNVTDLGSRKWFEVMIVANDGPDTTCADWLPCDVPPYPPDAVIVGNGPGGSGVFVTTGGSTHQATWEPMCGDNALDAEGCASKAIRRPWSVTDNQDGTITVDFNGHRWTEPGSFPVGPVKVVFKDHSYTPDKDAVPIGHTWHWDNIVVA